MILLTYRLIGNFLWHNFSHTFHYANLIWYELHFRTINLIPNINPIQDGGIPCQFFPCNFYNRKN